MAQIKSQIKRIKTNEKAHKKNNKLRTMIKNSTKNVLLAIKKKDIIIAKKYFKNTTKLINKAVNVNIKHKNNANRKKSKLAKLINKLEKEQKETKNTDNKNNTNN